MNPLRIAAAGDIHCSEANRARVTEADFRSRSANSWLIGETVKGRVRMTMAAGRVAYEG